MFKSKQLLVSSGRHEPFGATFVGNGVNFALYSHDATSVELLLWTRRGAKRPTHTFKLSPAKNRTGHIWHIMIENLPLLTRYAYRVDGPTDNPAYRFDPTKVLLDPYARAIDTRFYSRELACYPGVDNVDSCLRGIIIDRHQFDWGEDALPRVPEDKTVIYETHPRGFTIHPSSKVRFRGTFAGLTEKLTYLKDLGVTTLELMPVFAFDDDLPYQNPRGEELINYWGYSTISYFALQPSYFSQGVDYHLSEFKQLVKKAHSFGIEIILDVVYNHTGESNQNGPSLSWRGIDNATYYLLSPADAHYDMNLSGCGNTFRANNPVAARMIVDSLEYLAREFHVDGFRFDLGGVLYYKNEQFTHLPMVIKLINDSPILRELKLISEPWDAAGLVLEGRFGGPNWLEWNGSFRNRIRRFVNYGKDGNDVQAHLRGDAPEFRFYQKNPVKSVNFVTSHDGFTLRDLVSYNWKHNEENGFHNTDGSDDNESYNYGAEGETDQAEINGRRREQALTMLELAAQAPGPLMILMGDELWRTQAGNNNAFCQDNAISWLDWSALARERDWWGRVRAIMRAKAGWK